MVRGNKFKPQVVEPPAPAVAAAAAPAGPPTPATANNAVLVPASLKRQHNGTDASTSKAAPVKRSRGDTQVPAAHAPPPPKKHAIPTTTAANASGSNWAALQAANLVSNKKKAKANGGVALRGKPAAASTPTSTTPARPDAVNSTAGATRILAIDCEMVGVGPGGARSSLARVCVVNDAGTVLLDTHVAQVEPVTDWRTRVSGITRASVVGATPPDVVRRRVAALVSGRILVGHSITHDLQALLLGHPRSLVRDTARYPPLMRATAPGRRPKPRRLRDLAAEHLGLAIQDGSHSPVDDARAALYLYKRHRKQWEAALARGGVHNLSAPVPVRGAKRAGDAAAAALAKLAEKDDMADV